VSGQSVGRRSYLHRLGCNFNPLKGGLHIGDLIWGPIPASRDEEEEVNRDACVARARLPVDV
jgi:hypothetical protein